MADSKFSNVRALVQDGSLTNLATASPWTVTHSGGSGLTLTTASRIIAESDPIGRAATLCAEAVVSLDTAFAGSTVLSAGLASIAMNSDGQLGCMLDGIQVDVLNIPLASQRVLCAIEYGVDGANENYFFRATGETSGGTVSTTAVASALTYPGNATSKTVVGGLLGDTVQASPAQGTVNVSTTRPGVASTAVPHIVAIEPAIYLLDGRTAPSTGGTVTVTAERGSSSVTYTIPNTAGMSINSLGAALAAGIASQIGGTTSTSGGKTYITTATNEDNQNWFIWFNALGLSYPAEPPVWGPSNAGGAVFQERITQSGVYGAPGGSVTQRNVISLTLPAANANMNLAVSLQPTLNATANMGVVAAGLDSLVAQIAAAGFTASWQQIGAGQYVISTERLTPGAFTLVASLTVGASSVPNPVTTLHGLRVTDAARYLSSGGMPLDFPTLPWPTTSIPPGGGGGGGQLPTDVWLALGFEGGSAADLSTYAHTKLTQDSVTLPTTGSRTSDGYAEAANGATALNYAADLDELNGLTGITIEFDFYIPTNSQYGYFFGPTGSVYMTADTTAGNGTVTIVTNGWIDPLSVQGITFSAGAWHHIAIVGGATNCRFFVDGVEAGASGYGMSTTNFSPNIGAETTLGILNISSRADLVLCQGMRLDNVLITKSEKYSGNFTPPTKGIGASDTCLADPLASSVDLLVHADTSIADSSRLSTPTTVTGSVPISSDAKFGAGSMTFTAAGPGAVALTTAVDMLAGSSWAIDFWEKHPTGTTCVLAENGGDKVTGLWIGQSGYAAFGSTHISSSNNAIVGTAPAGQWNHIAVTNDGTTARLFVNGVEQGTYTALRCTFKYIGAYESASGWYYFDGLIDEFRLTVGQARYTAGFAVPTDAACGAGEGGGSDIQVAGYNDLDTITGAGTFNTQLTAPDAYFFSQVTLDDAVSTGDAYTLDGNSINFTGSRTLGATTCTGTFVRGTPQNFDSDVTLDDNTAVSTFYADTPKEWSGDSALDDATQFGLMMFLAPASFSGDATAEDTYSDGVADVITPPTMRVSTTLPALRLTASGAPRAFSGVVTTLPELTATARGGHYSALTLPTITAAATGTTIAMARAIVTIPMVEVEAAGRVAGQSSAQFRLPRIEATSFGGHQAELTLPEITASAAVTTGNAAQASFSLPRVTATAQGHRDDTARAAITLPAIVPTPSAVVEITLPAFTVLAHGQPVLTDAYEAYVLNMNQPLDDNPRNNFEAKVEQVTRYTNWPFIQVVRLGDAYYGVAEDGLYELGGATDNGTEIDWDFETCKTDFDDPHKKAVASAYIGGQTGPDLTYTLRSGDDVDRMYEYVTTKVVQKRNHRQKFGLGRRVRYYSFGLAGRGEAAIDTLEFELLSTTRRI